jgi:DNA-binding response OmpR family regulator
MSQIAQRLRILVADADLHTRDATMLALRARGHDVVALGEWPAIAEALSGAFDAIVADMVMAPLAHGEIVDRLRRAQPKAVLVVVSSGFLLTSRPVARAFGADAFIERPASMDTLEAAIEHARSEHPSAAA